MATYMPKQLTPWTDSMQPPSHPMTERSVQLKYQQRKHQKIRKQKLVGCYKYQKSSMKGK